MAIERESESLDEITPKSSDLEARIRFAELVIRPQQVLAAIFAGEQPTRDLRIERMKGTPIQPSPPKQG